MKRIIYFLLIVVGMGAAMYLLLFSCDLLDTLKDTFDLIKGGDWKWTTFNEYTVFVYGLAMFLFIVVVLFLALVVMALTTLCRFDRVHRFYATAVWYLIAAMFFTGAVVYTLFQGELSFSDALNDLPWEYYVPIGSAVVLMIVGFIFKKTERNNF